VKGVSLRLAWANPNVVERQDEPRVDLRLVAPPAEPTRQVKLDLAIERHLSGHYGLSDEQFLGVFSGAAARG
jgi:hypothetical protein